MHIPGIHPPEGSNTTADECISTRAGGVALSDPDPQPALKTSGLEGSSQDFRDVTKNKGHAKKLDVNS